MDPDVLSTRFRSDGLISWGGSPSARRGRPPISLGCFAVARNHDVLSSVIASNFSARPRAGREPRAAIEQVDAIEVDGDRQTVAFPQRRETVDRRPHPRAFAA